MKHRLRLQRSGIHIHIHHSHSLLTKFDHNKFLEFLIDYHNDRDEGGTDIDRNNEKVSILPAPCCLCDSNNVLTDCCAHGSCTINDTCDSGNCFLISLKCLLFTEICRASCLNHIVETTNEETHKEH